MCNQCRFSTSYVGQPSLESYLSYEAYVKWAIYLFYHGGVSVCTHGTPFLSNRFGSSVYCQAMNEWQTRVLFWPYLKAPKRRCPNSPGVALLKCPYIWLRKWYWSSPPGQPLRMPLSGCPSDEGGCLVIPRDLGCNSAYKAVWHWALFTRTMLHFLAS